MIARPEHPPHGPSRWRGPDLVADQWSRPLEAVELEELLRIGDSIDLDDPTALIEPMPAPPALRALADTVRTALLDGLGFCVLTGFPVADLESRRIASAYLVLGRLVGGLRSQNADGHLLGHVRNVGARLTDPTTRIYQTNHRQTFHTDSCDAVSLLCLQTAKSGGESLLVSVEAAYAAVAERRPDLAARLFEPVATDRRGELPPGAEPWFEIPVLTWFDGRLTGLYQRQYVDSAARLDGAPPLDDQQIEALDLFDEVMNDPALHLSVAFAPGDIQFVNNHALLHDRAGFVDHADRPRHLLRLWLCMPGARKLPEVFAQRYGSVTIGDRGGILTESTALSIAL